MRYVVLFLGELPSEYCPLSDNSYLNKIYFSNLSEFKKFCSSLEKSGETFITFCIKDDGSDKDIFAKLFQKIFLGF